ncbi:hypothetical protein [Nostoc sp. CCY 9925]|uniref:hypothetical protein n=1 Tax=Nostoc sp. CCY 9925 TaxID=3103865 RepID=UPI0039C70747
MEIPYLAKSQTTDWGTYQYYLRFVEILKVLNTTLPQPITFAEVVSAALALRIALSSVSVAKKLLLIDENETLSWFFSDGPEGFVVGMLKAIFSILARSNSLDLLQKFCKRLHEQSERKAHATRAQPKE